MKNLTFKRVVLLSDSQKSANQFEFQTKYNLITAHQNSCGKTSLVKALFWALGCDPHDIPDSWKELDCKVLVECEINGIICKFYRYQNNIKISVGGQPYEKFASITGAYARKFSELVGFSALLPNRPSKDEEPELETPPPAYYFLPFYIDQKKGWNEPWSGFDRLAQYEDWKRTIVKFHTGYLPPRHFVIEQEIYEHKKEERIAENEIKRINTALAVVDEYVPKAKFTIDEMELKKITDEVQEKLQDLSRKQETTLDVLARSTSEKYHLSKQAELLNEAIRELEADYTFSVENIDGDDLECPLCGTHHDNTIISKAEILADKKQLETQSKTVNRQLLTLNKEIASASRALDELKAEIEVINTKYSLEGLNGDRANLANIVDSLASRAVQKSVNTSKDQKQLLSKKAQDAQKELKKEQAKLLSKKDIDDRNAYFTSQLEAYIHQLSASGVSMNGVKSPTDYKKLFKDGGAAESTRAILAYQVTVIDMIALYGTEILAPFVVDTPRQQEQNDLNYTSMIKLILEKLPKQQQVFLCALDDPLIEPFKNGAQVIILNETDKILKTEHYECLRQEILEAIEAK